jgi:hypothetical protein
MLSTREFVFKDVLSFFSFGLQFHFGRYQTSTTNTSGLWSVLMVHASLGTKNSSVLISGQVMLVNVL